MTPISRATRLLNKLYRSVLRHMRCLEHRMKAGALGKITSDHTSFEQLEPKLMMSASLELNLAASYTTAEDTMLDFGAQAVGLTVSDTSDDEYSIDLSTSYGSLYAPLPGGGSVSGASITLEGDSLAEINSILDDVEFTPSQDYNGTADISYDLSDDSLNHDLGTISVDVTAVNDAPTLTIPATISLDEDNTFSFTGGNAISIGDVESDTGDFSIVVALPLSAGEISYTLPANVSESNYESEYDDVQQLDFGGTLADINTLLSSFQYVPASNYNGSFGIFVHVADHGPAAPNTVEFDHGTISVTVNAVNDVPTLITPASISLDEDNTFSFTDGNAISIGDVESDTGDFSIVVALPLSAGEISYTLPANVSESNYESEYDDVQQLDFGGTLADINTLLSSFQYVPASNYNGGFSIYVHVADHGPAAPSTVEFDSGTIAVTVNAVNDAPTLTIPASISLDEDNTFSFTGGNAISIGDVEPDTGTFTLTVVLPLSAGDMSYTLPANVSESNYESEYEDVQQLYFDGTLADINTLLSSFQYVPASNYNGGFSIYVHVADHGPAAPSTVEFDSGTIAVTVNAVNDAPTATAVSVELDEDDTAIVDVLTGADDVDGDTLSVLSVGTASHGTVTINVDDTLTYTPDANYHGSDSFSFTITDGNGGQVTENASVTVASVNDAPTATAVSVELDEDDTAIVDVLTGADDVDGDTLSVLSVGAASHGTVTINVDDTLTYTPDAEYYGSDSFSFTITDGNGGQVTENVSVTVNEIIIEPGATVIATSVQDGNDLVLIVCGTDGDDEITIDQVATGLDVYSGSTGTLYTGSFDRVEIYAFDGDDWLRTCSSVTLDTYISGGDDDDKIYHNGLVGDADLYGNDGDDLLVSIGNSANTLYGGSGFDSFWCDDNDTIYDLSTAENNAQADHVIEEFYQPYTDDSSDPDYVPMTINGQDFDDPTLTVDANGWGDYSDSPLFVGTPVYSDVNQGALGDCFYLAVLAGYANDDPDVITQMVTDLGDGTYVVRFFGVNGENYVRVDAELPTYNGLLAYAQTGEDGEIWVAIAEKAYAYYRTGENDYDSLNGGTMGIVYVQITGHDAWQNSSISTWSASYMLSTLEYLLDNDYIVSVGSDSTIYPIVGSHAYAVMGVDYEGSDAFVTVYNPWGVDGALNYDDDYSDGLLRLTLGQFMSVYVYMAWTV